MSGDAVKIYFCDICNESIPLKDLELGAAIAIKGKVICHRCNPQTAAVRASVAAAGGGSFTPVPVASAMGNGSPGLTGWIAAIALIVSGGSLLLFLLERDTTRGSVQGLQQHVQSTGSEHGRGIDEIRSKQEGLEQRIPEIEKRLKSEILAKIEKEITSSENRRALLEERVAGLLEDVRDVEGMRTRVEQIDAWKGATMQTLASIKSDLEGYLQELRVVKEAAAKASAVAQQPAVVAPIRPDPVPLPGWDDILRRLKDPDPGVRWSAILDLGQTGDPRAVPYLIPLLKDADNFVRKNAADTLGELDSRSAVGDLIEALGDAEHFVREAVYTTLKKITKQSIKFDPFAKSKDERDRGIQAWRDWWAANKAKLVGS